MDSCVVSGCSKPVHAVGMCSSHRSYWNRRKNARPAQCDQCGEDFMAERKGQTLCSRLCSATSAGVLGRARLAEITKLRGPGTDLVLYVAPKRVTPTPAHVVGTRLFTAGACRVCDAAFVSLHLDVTCSGACKLVYRARQRREARDRRRALKRGAFVANVSPSKVFEMDGYRCHLCGKKVDMTKKVPHPRAATVDHVIPLALAGTHEPANCRTACFRCNSTKGHRGSGDQMLLFA